MTFTFAGYRVAESVYLTSFFNAPHLLHLCIAPLANEKGNEPMSVTHLSFNHCTCSPLCYCAYRVYSIYTNRIEYIFL